MAASVLKQDPNTSNVKKIAIYDGKTQHANFRGKPLFQTTKQHINNSKTVKNEIRMFLTNGHQPNITKQFNPKQTSIVHLSFDRIVSAVLYKGCYYLYNQCVHCNRNNVVFVHNTGGWGLMAGKNTPNTDTIIIGGSCHEYHFCRGKHVFVATKHVFCHDKSMLVAITFFSTKYICRDKYLSRQTLLSRQAYFCRDKRRVAKVTHVCRDRKVYFSLLVSTREKFSISLEGPSRVCLLLVVVVFCFCFSCFLLLLLLLYFVFSLFLHFPPCPRCYLVFFHHLPFLNV